LDSSILIGAAIPGSNHAEATQKFCQLLASERAVVVFSVIARYEFAHIARALASPDDRRKLPETIVSAYDLGEWDGKTEVRRRWISAAQANLERLLNQFAYFVEVPIRNAMWPDTLEVIINHRFRSYDALHIATARYFEVEDLATCDRHFADIDGLNVMVIRNE
jgi:predicted nucleic acid-binding protein